MTLAILHWCRATFGTIEVQSTSSMCEFAHLKDFDSIPTSTRIYSCHSLSLSVTCIISKYNIFCFGAFYEFSFAIKKIIFMRRRTTLDLVHLASSRDFKVIQYMVIDYFGRPLNFKREQQGRRIGSFPISRVAFWD